MRLLLVVLVALAAVPAAFADDHPSPAVVAACQAEAAQLGRDAFVAKYGPSEPFGHCYAAHGGATTTTTTTTATVLQDPPAVAACKAEAERLGKDAFVATYGPSEPSAHCVAGQRPAAKAIEPRAACLGEARKTGKDAFVAKYGAHEPFAACVKAQKKPKR